MRSETTRFPIAPMSRLIRVLTWLLLAIPVVFAALWRAFGAPLAWPALALAALYLATWLAARPSRFELDARRLRVCFPLWTRALPRASISSARVVPVAELRELLGIALRVGVGGLWGGFGWLWSTKRGWVELYVSRGDGLVWIERRGGLPLLITPTQPETFVARVAPPVA
jgi:hypothetical protein